MKAQTMQSYGGINADDIYASGGLASMTLGDSIDDEDWDHVSSSQVEIIVEQGLPIRNIPYPTYSS